MKRLISAGILAFAFAAGAASAQSAQEDPRYDSHNPHANSANWGVGG